MKKIFGIFSVLALGFSSVTVFADDYIAVAKNGNVYDEANAKYITLNQNNDEVSVVPGMVFKTNEHKPGWYQVEYSPGLHAFIPEQIVATNFNPIKGGSYKISNNPSQTLNISGNGDEWTATIGGQTYKGSKFEQIVIFEDNEGDVAFSLVDIGSGPIVITYDNAVTKFF